MRRATPNPHPFTVADGGTTGRGRRSRVCATDSATDFIGGCRFDTTHTPKGTPPPLSGGNASFHNHWCATSLAAHYRFSRLRRGSGRSCGYRISSCESAVVIHTTKGSLLPAHRLKLKLLAPRDARSGRGDSTEQVRTSRCRDGRSDDSDAIGHLGTGREPRRTCTERESASIGPLRISY